MVRLTVEAEGISRSVLVSRQSLYAALFGFILLTVYTEIPLYLTETFYIPSFLTVLSIPLLAAVCRTVHKQDALFILKIAGVLLLTALLSPGRAFIGHKFIGVIQTMTSITAGMLLFRLMTLLDEKTLRKVLFVLSAALVVGSLLEVSGLIKGFSDSFREAVYVGDGYRVYENDARDIALTGFSRPKLFTSEPSLLAIGFFAFVNSWLILAFNRRNFLTAVLATLVMIFTTGSPILLLSLSVSFVTIMLNIRRAAGRVLAVVMAAALFVLLAAILYSATEFGPLLMKRMTSSAEHAASYTVTSENLRIVFPYITLVDVMRGSPVFGTGISGKEVVEAYSTLPLDPALAFGNNNLAAMFIYFGAAGSALFLLVFIRYLRGKGVENVFMLAVILTFFSQGMGAFESPRFWGYVFLFIGVMFKFSEGGPARQKEKRPGFIFKILLKKEGGLNEGS